MKSDTRQLSPQKVSRQGSGPERETLGPEEPQWVFSVNSLCAGSQGLYVQRRRQQTDSDFRGAQSPAPRSTGKGFTWEQAVTQTIRTPFSPREMLNRNNIDTGCSERGGHLWEDGERPPWILSWASRWSAADRKLNTGNRLDGAPHAMGLCEPCGMVLHEMQQVPGRYFLPARAGPKALQRSRGKPLSLKDTSLLQPRVPSSGMEEKGSACSRPLALWPASLSGVPIPPTS